ncbi:hypothetical protein BH23BAC3_BH23BAC3_27350 [soil metagenome]
MNRSDYSLSPKLFTGLVLFFLIVGVVLPAELRSGWFTGYGIGLLAILLHFVTSTFTDKWNNKHFFLFYGPVMLIRLIIVLGIFIGLLLTEKFDQFSFTVSFLISYICHSIINIILLNKELTNRSG